jgi:hypothetical protein
MDIGKGLYPGEANIYPRDEPRGTQRPGTLPGAQAPNQLQEPNQGDSRDERKRK